MPSRRFELAGFRLAVDAVRRRRGLTWTQVAVEAGMSASPLTLLGPGSNPDVDTIASLVAWADLDPGPFFPMAEDTLGAGKADVPEDTEQGSKRRKMDVYLGLYDDSWPPDEPDEYFAPPGYPAAAVL